MATRRIGTTQHLMNRLLPIRAEGDLPLANGDRLLPDPILVGRTADKLEALARRVGVTRWTIAEDAPNTASLAQAARGLQLIEACHESHDTRRWVDLPRPGGIVL